MTNDLIKNAKEKLARHKKAATIAVGTLIAGSVAGSYLLSSKDDGSNKQQSEVLLKFSHHHDIDDYSKMETAISAGASINATDDKGNTALHNVLQQDLPWDYINPVKQFEEKVNLLLKHNINVTKPNADNLTPLDLINDKINERKEYIEECRKYSQEKGENFKESKTDKEEMEILERIKSKITTKAMQQEKTISWSDALALGGKER